MPFGPSVGFSKDLAVRAAETFSTRDPYFYEQVLSIKSPWRVMTYASTSKPKTLKHMSCTKVKRRARDAKRIHRDMITASDISVTWIFTNTVRSYYCACRASIAPNAACNSCRFHGPTVEPDSPYLFSAWRFHYSGDVDLGGRKDARPQLERGLSLPGFSGQSAIVSRRVVYERTRRGRGLAVDDG